jgi:hypothetical protein
MLHRLLGMSLVRGGAGVRFTFARAGALRVLAGGPVAAALAAAARIVVPRWRTANDHMPAGGPRPAGVSWGRRRLLVTLPVGAGAIGIGWLVERRSPPSAGREYQEVARWRLPEGEGWFITVGPEPTLDELRALGERLRAEFRHLDNTVVMIFDDPEAARQVRTGSRMLGEEGFQRALIHQRAMYLKSTARGEHSLTLYGGYPEVREVIRY